MPQGKDNLQCFQSEIAVKEFFAASRQDKQHTNAYVRHIPKKYAVHMRKGEAPAVKRKIIEVFALILLILLVIWLYWGIRGQAYYVTNIGRKEIDIIESEFNITLPLNSEIKSLAYMTSLNDSFFVLEIKMDNTEEFISVNKSAFSDINNKIKNSFLFPTNKYLPKAKGVTAYYTTDTVYLSVWSWEYHSISGIYFDLKN